MKPLTVLSSGELEMVFFAGRMLVQGSSLEWCLTYADIAGDVFSCCTTNLMGKTSQNVSVLENVDS